MADLKQELADVQAAIEKVEAQESAAIPPAAPGKVKLRHPHTGDIQEVEATPEKLVPLMGLGYVQVPGGRANNMPARVQQLILGLGKGKQTNISTAAATFLRFKKLDTV